MRAFHLNNLPVGLVIGFQPTHAAQEHMIELPPYRPIHAITETWFYDAMRALHICVVWVG